MSSPNLVPFVLYGYFLIGLGSSGLSLNTRALDQEFGCLNNDYDPRASIGKKRRKRHTEEYQDQPCGMGQFCNLYEAHR